MGRDTKVFQIVGFQNSGKTTLIQEVLQYGEALGLKIGTIKHHGHGGSPDVKMMEKDGDRHLHAGAVFAAVEGSGELLIKNQSKYWSLDELLNIYHHFSLDLIVIEGYKHARLPKAVIIRNNEDLPLLEDLVHVEAIITWIPLAEQKDIPVFSVHKSSAFAEWLFHSFFNESALLKNNVDG